MKLFEQFKDLLYLGYIKKQGKIEPTEDYLFLVSQLFNNKNHVLIRNEIIKFDIFNKKHVKEAIKPRITSKS